MDVKQAGGTGDANRGLGQPDGQTAVGQAAKLGDDVRERGARLVEDVKHQATSQAERQKDGAADQVEDVAASVHQTADALKQGQQPWLADLVERGADELGAFANTLRGNDLQGLLSQVETFARRQPALFAGASMAAGFALARMARLATEERTPAAGPASRPSGPGDETEQAIPDQQSRAETSYPGAVYHG